MDIFGSGNDDYTSVALPGAGCYTAIGTARARDDTPLGESRGGGGIEPVWGGHRFMPREMSGSLFDDPDDEESPPEGAPLAERLRPRSLDEFVGQAHLVGP